MWALWNEFLFPFIRPKLPYLRHWRELTAKLFWKQGYFVFILCRSRVLEYFCTLLQARYIREYFFFICFEIGTFSKFKRNKKVTFKKKNYRPLSLIYSPHKHWCILNNIQQSNNYYLIENTQQQIMYSTNIIINVIIFFLITDLVK